MSAEEFQNKYRIPSARAKWHDYNGGMYFITVCTKNREHFFGEITRRRDVARHVSTENEPKMQLTEIGQYLYDNLQNATAHYPYAEIPLFVVMPNHWHAIMIIDVDKIPGRDVARHVSTRNEKMRDIRNQKGWLAAVVGGIKSAVTKYANENGIEFVWQTRFHDHIIRNQETINKIADYIENNVARWDTDRFNNNNGRDVARHVSTAEQQHRTQQ